MITSRNPSDCRMKCPHCRIYTEHTTVEAHLSAEDTESGVGVWEEGGERSRERDRDRRPESNEGRHVNLACEWGCKWFP